ncbi:MAG: carbon storage regulator [Planctomycetaceae bacterium]|jgi:carbon storage regulator|nr:carbon storage regulator [Planctomycetaceae bacterium]
MLVLTRKEGEKICIGDDVVITIVRTGGDKVRLGIDAPSDKVILRSELKAKERQETKETIPIVPLVLPCSVDISKCS